MTPAGASRGQTVTVSASGSFSTWPVKIWVDRPGLEISSAKDKGKLNFAIAENAAVGVYWVRVYDAEGASTPRPFIVGHLPETAERETNDLPDAPQQLDAACVVNGVLSKSGDVDVYSISAKRGNVLVASMTANRLLGSPMDAVLQVCDQRGFVLCQNDDERGIDPQVSFPIPSDGTYLVRTFAFPETANSTIGFSGAATYVYRLTVTNSGFIDHVSPMSVTRGKSGSLRLFGWNLPKNPPLIDVSASDGADTVTVFHEDYAGSSQVKVTDHHNVLDSDEISEMKIPATVSGRIGAAGEIDAFRFHASKGKKVHFHVESQSLGFALDPVIRVVNNEGDKTLSEIDDVAKARDPSLTFTPPADGAYQFQILDLHGRGGLRFVYRIDATELAPGFTLQLAADSYVCKSGQSIEIPVTVVRENGFAGEIKVLADGLPEGVQCPPLTSAGKGDTAKSVKLKVTAGSKDFSGPIRIVGSSDDLADEHATFALPNVADRMWRLWFTIATSSDK